MKVYIAVFDVGLNGAYVEPARGFTTAEAAREGAEEWADHLLFPETNPWQTPKSDTGYNGYEIVEIEVDSSRPSLCRAILGGPPLLDAYICELPAGHDLPHHSGSTTWGWEKP